MRKFTTERCPALYQIALSEQSSVGHLSGYMESIFSTSSLDTKGNNSIIAGSSYNASYEQ